MKIIYCIAATCNSGGMERVLADKANYLVNHGYEVVVITTDQRGRPSFFPLDGRIQSVDLGINYEANNGKSFLNKLLHYPFRQWRHKQRLAAALNQMKPDITISMFCNDASFLWKIKDGSRKMLEVHFSRYKRLQYGRRGVWKIADRWRHRRDGEIVKHYEKFIVLTHEDKSCWGPLSNITVIPNALFAPPVVPAVPDKKRVLAVGRYSYQKGFDLLIDAWEIIHDFEPEWTLDIVGEGEWKARLQEQIKKCRLGGSVRLKAPTSHIEEEYRQASLLVMTSRYEGLPMVLLEALSWGLPVVAFACKCGPRDVISDGEDGFLIAEKNIFMLADKVLELMEDESLRKQMGEKAFANSSRFAAPVIMRQWEELFKNNQPE